MRLSGGERTSYITPKTMERLPDYRAVAEETLGTCQHVLSHREEYTVQDVISADRRRSRCERELELLDVIAFLQAELSAGTGLLARQMWMTDHCSRSLDQTFIRQAGEEWDSPGRMLPEVRSAYELDAEEAIARNKGGT